MLCATLYRAHKFTKPIGVMAHKRISIVLHSIRRNFSVSDFLPVICRHFPLYDVNVLPHLGQIFAISTFVRIVQTDTSCATKSNRLRRRSVHTLQPLYHKRTRTAMAHSVTVKLPLFIHVIPHGVLYWSTDKFIQRVIAIVKSNIVQISRHNFRVNLCQLIQTNTESFSLTKTAAYIPNVEDHFGRQMRIILIRETEHLTNFRLCTASHCASLSKESKHRIIQTAKRICTILSYFTSTFHVHNL